MRQIILYMFFVFLWLPAYSQPVLVVDSTRFISGNKGGTRINCAIPTGDKGIFFAGSHNGNPGGIIPYFPLDSVEGNVFCGKIDSNRQISWLKVYGGSRYDLASSVCQTADGGCAILGTTASSNGDVTGWQGAGDIWLLKLDAMGNLLWQHTYGSVNDEHGISLAATPDHGFIILGESNGSGGDVPGHYGDMWSFDWVVIKTDSDGNVQWSKTMGGTGNDGRPGSILSIDNSYYLIASSNSRDHDCTDSSWHLGVNTDFDLYVFKLDGGGNVLWDSSYGGSKVEVPQYAMYDERDTTIMIAGWTTSYNYMVEDAHGLSDIWVLKINKNGTLVWTKTLGYWNNEEGTGLCAAANGGYLVYGSVYTGTIGARDAQLTLLDAAGNEVNNKIFGGTAHESPASVLPYHNGYVATGTSGSVVFTEGSCNENKGDAFVSYLSYRDVGVEDINYIADGITVYPNPANEQVTIQVPQNNGTITIINMVGQVACQKQAGLQPAEMVGTAQWAPGMYMVRWCGDNGTVRMARFVKL